LANKKNCYVKLIKIGKREKVTKDIIARVNKEGGMDWDDLKEQTKVFEEVLDQSKDKLQCSFCGTFFNYTSVGNLFCRLKVKKIDQEGVYIVAQNSMEQKGTKFTEDAKGRLIKTITISIDHRTDPLHNKMMKRPFVVIPLAFAMEEINSMKYKNEGETYLVMDKEEMLESVITLNVPKTQYNRLGKLIVSLKEEYEQMLNTFGIRQRKSDMSGVTVNSAIYYRYDNKPFRPSMAKEVTNSGAGMVDLDEEKRYEDSLKVIRSKEDERTTGRNFLKEQLPFIDFKSYFSVDGKTSKLFVPFCIILRIDPQTSTPKASPSESTKGDKGTKAIENIFNKPYFY
jgi:hypothetical protein